LWNWIVRITTETENKAETNVIQPNQEPSPQNTTERNPKNFKNTAYLLHTASTIYKGKSGMYRQKWMKDNVRSYNMHVAVLYLLIREIQMFHL
jgi:hypothetical protein